MSVEIHAEHRRGWKLFRPLLEKIVEQLKEEEQDQFDAFAGQASTYGLQTNREYYGRVAMLSELVQSIDEVMKDGR